MEITRVLIDTGDPCPGCGAAAAVFEHATSEQEWVVEARECSHGCDELVSAIPAGGVLSAPARSRRRRRVA